MLKTIKINLKSLILITIIFLVLSCNTESQTDNYFVNNYKNGRSLFSDSTISFFPDVFDENEIAVDKNINSSYKDQPRKILYLSVYKKYEKEDKIKLENFITSLDSYDLLNPCLFTIQLNFNRYGFNRYKNGRENCIDFIPIPHHTLFSIDNYPSDLKFYFIQISKGIKTEFNEKRYSRDYLPEEWKNGLSRGFAISVEKQVILYWVMIW